MDLRGATSADAEAIADLHADSWRRNYRGAYLDAFLDGDVVTDRRAVWTERLRDPGSDTNTVVAVDGDAVVGFVHTVFDDDPTWGALLDNLHVVHDRKGGGIGTQLMAASARGVLARPRPTGLYLWVLEVNTAGQSFYRARGGRAAGRELRGPFPGGGRAYAFRYAWPDPTALVISGAARPA